MTKVGLDAIGTSTTLESNKSLEGNKFDARAGRYLIHLDSFSNGEIHLRGALTPSRQTTC